MNDLTLQKARAYEAEHGAAISPAERPAYHMTPYVGWLNDPNGFSYYKGKYHQFYQYNPYDVRWAPMHWGSRGQHRPAALGVSALCTRPGFPGGQRPRLLLRFCYRDG